MSRRTRTRILDLKLRTFCDGLENKDEAFGILKSLNLKDRNVSIVNGRVEGIYYLSLNANMPAIRSIQGHKDLERVMRCRIPHTIFEDIYAITGTETEVRDLIRWITSDPELPMKTIPGIAAGFAYIRRLDPPIVFSGPIYDDACLMRNGDGHYMIISKRVLERNVSNDDN